LAALLGPWRVVAASKKSEDIRGGGGSEPNSWRSLTVGALELLRHVERAIDGMEAEGEDVEHFRASMQIWLDAILSLHAPWTTAVSTQKRELMSAADLRLLKSLGTMLARREKDLPRLDGEYGDAVRDHLKHAEALIREAVGDADTRRYLLALIVEAKECLEEVQTFGTAQARSVVVELGGLLQSMADTPDIPMEEEKRTRLRDVAMKLVYGVAGNAAWTGMQMLATGGAAHVGRAIGS
jgi:hypothetical protein